MNSPFAFTFTVLGDAGTILAGVCELVQGAGDALLLSQPCGEHEGHEKQSQETRCS